MFKTIDMAVAEADIDREIANNNPFPIETDMSLELLPSYVPPRRLVMQLLGLCNICGRLFNSVGSTQINYLFGWNVCHHPNCQTVCRKSALQYGRENDMYISFCEPYQTIINAIPNKVKFFRARINGLQEANISSRTGSYFASEEGPKMIHINVTFIVDGQMYNKFVPLRNLLQHNVDPDLIATFRQCEGLDEPLTNELNSTR